MRRLIQAIRQKCKPITAEIARPRRSGRGFWEGIRSGLPLREAAAAAGVHRHQAEAWFREAGGVAGRACGRCVITTIDQGTGERGLQPIKILGSRRRFGHNLVFGQGIMPDSLA
jgi:hypothetical protein